MNKLTKAQEKRFDKLYEGKEPARDDFENYLADELARQKKEIIKKLEKLKGWGKEKFYVYPESKEYRLGLDEGWENSIDQAIKTIA